MKSQDRVVFLGLNHLPEPTGIAPYTTAMARGIAQRGLPVRVLTAHPHYPEWHIRDGYGQWTRREVLDDVDVQRLLHYVPRRPKGALRALSEISFGVRLAFARWGRPDVIIAVSPALLSTAIAFGRSRLTHRRTPFIVWVQDLYSLGLSETGQGGGAVLRAMQVVEGWLLRRATRVVVIHDRFASRVAQDFSVRPEHVAVVRNWTHLPTVPAVDVASARARFGWADDEAIVLHAGNMGVKQGLENVVEAARIAHGRNVPIRFVLLGGGGERERLRRLAGSLPSIQFIDPLDDEAFAQALGAADILLVNEKPGVAEMAMPSKLTSYFATGRPVLAATDPGGITAEEIRIADAGVVVTAGSPVDLLEGALALARDPHHGAQLGANGQRHRRTVLEEGTAIHRFITLIHEVVGDPGRI